MRDAPPFGSASIVGLLLVAACAAGTRAWYVYECADVGAGRPALQVQGPPPRPFLPAGTELRGQAEPTTLDNLVHNLQEHRWYGALAPLAEKEEQTAHVAPGYYWVFALVARFAEDVDRVVRWGQVGLGTLTAVCYFFFALRAFHSPLTATVAGLFCALHPFWIVNSAELADGVLASFLLSAVLMLGTRGSQVGGPFTSLLFGLALAALAMVRAALLPFALVAFVWFLWRCRQYRWGWFAGLLAFLGFANGLAPWAVRNYRVFGEPVPVVSSTYLHLWIGNNPQATGGPLDEPTLRGTLPPERLQQLLDEPNQVRRYGMLGQDLLQEITDHPTATVGRRIDAGQAFLLGDRWLRSKELAEYRESDVTEPPAWLALNAELILRASLLGMLVLALLGWRWSARWAWHSRLAALAMLWLPVPYLLSHADALSGPRLPLDGVLLCYAAYALTGLLPRPPEGDASRHVASA